MKTWKLEFNDLAGICYCEWSEDVKEYIENMDINDIITVTCEEMTEEEFLNLPEFEGF
ncbi:MAG: hypothetical protein OEV44_00155 [Spirochaetota bacterium]|nr:hypothetical protein [Spirochaetota bacterium]